MATRKQPALKNNTTTTKVRRKVPANDRMKKLKDALAPPFMALNRRTRSLLARRPHRSFRRTRRRDYARSLKLPGYWAFTIGVYKIIWQHKKLFIGLIVTYAFLIVLLNGIASQEAYTTLSEALKASGGEISSGNMGELGKAALLLGTGVLGAFNTETTDMQRLYAALLALLAWLTTVWLLRALMAGSKPKLRDGLYSSSAPLLSTFIISLVLILQLLPIALAFIGFSAASASGLLDTGIEAMLFWSVALLLGSLSLYWITSTIIALVVVTLPGMYPLLAFKTAGDLVIGRRVRILLRFLWMFLVTALLWIIVMVPIILFDTWLKSVVPSIKWMPIVPIFLLIVSSISVVWIAGYVYLLYRKVVDDDAAPA